jgi:coproporphyrinogen III oxidase-like Fe-S oxidoreductase
VDTLQQQLQQAEEVIQEALQVVADQTDAHKLALLHNTSLAGKIEQVRRNVPV